MRYVERICESLTADDLNAVVADVRIGLGYTAVRLEDNRAGVAYTFRDEAQSGCTVFHALRPIAGRPAEELLPLLKSRDPIETAVGLATVNALRNRLGPDMQTGDVLENVELRPDDAVGMVGHFMPLVETINNRAGSLTVFERIAEPEGYLRPVSEIADVLPSCQVALITATSIINHTIDEILDAAEQCREIVVLGASTPLLPAAAEPFGITCLSGIVVTEPDGILRVVSEGGGMRLFKPYVQKVCRPVRKVKSVTKK